MASEIVERLRSLPCTCGNVTHHSASCSYRIGQEAERVVGAARDWQRLRRISDETETWRDYEARVAAENQLFAALEEMEKAGG